MSDSRANDLQFCKIWVYFESEFQPDSDHAKFFESAHANFLKRVFPKCIGKNIILTSNSKSAQNCASNDV